MRDIEYYEQRLADEIDKNKSLHGQLTAANERIKELEGTFVGTQLCKLEFDNKALTARLKLAEELACVIEHGIKLGYLGDGSTSNWANQALDAWRKKQ